jgi:hypothetical protein
MLEQMQSSREAINEQLGTAREERDVVRVLCLTDKLGQLDITVESAEDRTDNLRDAISHADAEQAQHEFSLLTVLAERATILVSQANQCLGEEMGFLTEPELDVSVDPEIPEDASEVPVDAFVSRPPVVNSPTF